jgi:hypothetical protein
MRAPIGCPRESEVLDLVAIGHWPARAEADLVEHAAACPTCADLALAAGAIVELRDEAAMGPALPDASVVWYRAQRRAREAAARRAARPLVVVQGLALVCLVGLAAAWWTDGISVAARWWTRLAQLAPALPAAPSLPADVGRLPLVLWLLGGTLAAWLVLVPVAFYMAKLADRPDEAESVPSE